MSTAPSSSQPPAHEPKNPAAAHADVGADAALIMAALGRLDAAVRDERAVLARLRFGLGEMANAIVKAKATAESATTIALLDEFEHRIDAMIAIAGGAEEPPRHDAPAPQIAPAGQQVDPATAEPSEVPTVSGVVARLGPGDNEARSSVAEAAAGHAGVDASNVAMLTAMVQALRDSIPAATPETSAGAQGAPPAPEALEPAPNPDRAHTAGPASADVETTPAPAEADFDPAGLLFGPKLNLARGTAAAALPQPEFVSSPIEPGPEESQAPPPGGADPAHPAPSADANPGQPALRPAHDPLQALKAMSENERLALFS